MSLFKSGSFRLHGGATSWWKIDCDALTADDWDVLANLIAERRRFRAVVGVPRGGWPLEQALRPHVTDDPSLPTLIVDDVLTTGGSMETARRVVAGETIGAVAFARGPCPDWVRPLFVLQV